MNLYYYVMFWTCIVGLCLGSFFNVVILRSLTNESIVFPASKCPKCGNRLYFWHNIPVLSYILLKGRCYFCKEKISIQYPIVELITMLMFGLSFWRFGIRLTTLFVLLWISCLVIMVGTDIKAKIADCNFAIAIGVTGFIFNFLNNGLEGIKTAFLGMIVGILVLEIIARLGYVFAKTRAMGEADTYVAAAFGAVVGVENILQVLLYSLAFAMLFIVPLFLIKMYRNNEKYTLLSAILFIVSIFIYKFVWSNLLTMLLLMTTGITLAFLILKGMQKRENLSYLPYIPALAAGFIFYIFNFLTLY